MFPLKTQKTLRTLLFVFGASFNFVLDVVPGKGFVSVCVCVRKGREPNCSLCDLSSQLCVLNRYYSVTSAIYSK